ncbi:Uu.00g137860.m01.CDS01 [Anthostomella pinea]|uniref:Uu.00g137860.m01.CDS01 n=1 Tax=Anthostomella pinea TaxID=933095 RepID=A0AAI8VPN1_9PEZI|nr:Uu.00g137860.m01.CDS01 [Anthostomella pinea]
MRPDPNAAAPPRDKPLPVLPVLGATPPLPLWSEDQINALQSENKKLRQHILKHRRRESENHETIALLTQQNVCYLQEIERQDNKVTRIAGFVAATFEEYKHSRWSSSEEHRISTHTTIDDMIRIYSEL